MAPAYPIHKIPKLDPIHIDRGKDLKQWPRRLLHVPSMTSVEREKEYTYHGIVRPGYNILSYTWGRYELPSGPSLPIKNVRWKIPAIDPERFTVEEFKNVLEQASVNVGVEFLWLDVACIDQEDEGVKLGEIGRQAGIFSNAQDAFIWLHGTSGAVLQRACDEFFSLAGRLDGDEEVAIDGSAVEGTVNFERDNAGSDIAIGESEFIPHCLKNTIWIERVRDVLTRLTEDVWFSSLWTLQEAFLRPEATLLSREGEKAMRQGYDDLTLLSLLFTMGSLEQEVSKVLRLVQLDGGHELGAMRTNLAEIDGLLQKIGLGAWDNPNMLYHSAKYRKTTRVEDRIYGIMQVFGFRLGATSNLSGVYSLDDLEEQFALEINKTSPILAQMYVHTQPQSLGKCWRISQESDVPTTLRFFESLPASMCSISKSLEGYACFNGYSASFEDLLPLWANGIEQIKGYQFWGVDDAMQMIVLDNTDFLEKHVPENLRSCENEKWESNKDLTNVLKDIGGLRLLLLGRLLNSGDIDELDMEDETEDEMEDEIEDGMEDADDDEASKYQKPSTTGSVALLVQSVQHDRNTMWQRLGVCIWPLLDSEKDVWAAREYLLA